MIEVNSNVQASVSVHLDFVWAYLPTLKQTTPGKLDGGCC
jgi:hypothetical protein